MLNDKNQKRLETLLSAFDSGAVQPNELIEAMEAVMVIIKHSEKLFLSQIKDTSETSMRSITSLKAEIAQAHRDIQSLIKDAKENSTTETATLRRLVAQEVKRLEESMPIMPDEFDATEIQKSLEEHTELLAKISELISGENIRNALESLPDGEKQSIDSIQDLREELDKRQAEERGHTTAIIARRLDQILDVSIEGVTNGQVLTYNSTTKTWGAGSGGGGYTNLTSFVDQTAHRVFYSNGSGDVTELALGADGTFLKSNGASSAPSFATPAGSGDVAKVGTPVNNQVGVWTGDGTLEGDTALTFDTTTDTLATTLITATTVTANLVGNVTGTASGNLVSGGALGTPSSGTATNLTGTASGLTAGNVTTNANLTGVVTSTGNATAIADAALSIAKTSGLQSALDLKAPLASPTFTGTVVLPNSQALVTPVLGTPTSVTLTNATGLPISGLVNSISLALGLGTIELGHATDTTIARTAAGEIAVEGIRVLSARPKVLSAASYTTDTGTSLNVDNLDFFIVTAQTGALLFNAPGGTKYDGQMLKISVASSTTVARALTWNVAFGSTTVTLPSTTAATTATLTIGFIWSASKSLWQCVAVA